MAKLITAIGVIVPTLGVVAGLYFGASMLDLALFAAMSVLTGLGITIGFHRYWTHGSFETVRLVSFVLGALGSMAAQGSLFWWVGTHRQHHQFSDEGPDPHSPHVHGCGLCGLWWSHVGWLFAGKQPDARYTRDLYHSEQAQHIDVLFPVWVAAGLLIPFVISGWSGLLWGGLVRIFVVHHVTWSVNSICHIWGRQDFDTRDESRNVWWLTLFTLGEANHNTHHCFPKSACHGLRWYNFDLSYWLICLLESVGLAWNVKTIPTKLAGKMRIHQKMYYKK